MKKKLLCLTGAFVLAAFTFTGVAMAGLGVPGAGGDTVQVMDNGKTLTKACTGKTVVKVIGNENKVTLTGECGEVSVLGNANIVTVEAAAKISALGNRNKVTWERGVGGEKPAISNLGSGNEVKRKAK